MCDRGQEIGLRIYLAGHISSHLTTITADNGAHADITTLAHADTSGHRKLWLSIKSPVYSHPKSCGIKMKSRLAIDLEVTIISSLSFGPGDKS